MDSSSSTHRTGTTTNGTTSSELFICFNSRFSMKISAKPSILSPARARDPPISLTTSVSRRLRTSGSIKNGQASPIFPRKRGSGFDNPEPSSPKVTCIGQVRVKSKKKGRKVRTLPRRQSGEVSFRTLEQIQRQSSVNSQYQQLQQQEFLSHRNQKWVHLPSTLCGTLRGFPCKPSCFSTSDGEKEEENVGSEENVGGRSSCGALCGRWMVAVRDGEDEKGREIELEDGEGDDEEDVRPIRRTRRHVFDEIEIKDEIFEVKDDEGNDMEGEEGRVSICIPPKNALLLMRCRSDPVKMEALANRSWEPQLPTQEEEEEKEEEDEDEERKIDEDNEKTLNLEKVDVKDEVKMVPNENNFKVFKEERVSVSVVDVNEEEEENHPEAENALKLEVQDNEEEKPIEDLETNEEEKPIENLQTNEELQNGRQEEQEEIEESRAVVEEENELNFDTTVEEPLLDEDSEEDDEIYPMEDKIEDDCRVSYSNASFSLQSDEEISEPEEDEKVEEELAEEEAAMALIAKESTEEKDKTLELKVLDQENQKIPESPKTPEEAEEGTRKTEERNAVAVVERESDVGLKKEERESSRLPECLLLMMCEPKLSMEVSKETWVCSTDFIRWPPEKKKPVVQVKQTDGGDDEEPTKKQVSFDSESSVNSCAAVAPPHAVPQHKPMLQGPRSSCCLPATATAAAVSMATMIEQKLVNAVAYEPFVLTRCKSEPMRTASAKLVPDGCFWNKMTLEAHHLATFGIGAAGVGCQLSR